MDVKDCVPREAAEEEDETGSAGEEVERIQEEVKAADRRCCRHGGLFDPLSLFPPDLSRGHAYRVFFNREIHDAGLATCHRRLYTARRSPEANVLRGEELQERKGGNHPGRSGSALYPPRFRLSTCHSRFIQPSPRGYIAACTALSKIIP